MTKIADIVKLKTGYANFVELKSAYAEAQENAERMAMYRPTRSHRRAFERICKGVYQPNDKKFYLLSGSYGTGKSHLCLMTANFLSRSSVDPEIAGFYANYAGLDPETARMLKNIRKDGQYLVAICDYYSGKRFEDVVLKAVLEACEARGLNAGITTEFDEAERQLTDWEKKEDKGGLRNFYQDFENALGRVAPGLSAVQLRTGLKNYDSEALDQFRAAFQEMMGGLTFQSQSGNLIPILKNLIKSPQFKERFKGLAIFFDEFGFTLEKGAYAKDLMQGFMETVCRNEPNVIFVGCIHKDFKSYSDRLSQADAAVMTARITQVDLLNEGIEEIIGAIVETDRESPVWKKEVAPKTAVFNQLVPYCNTLDLFPWIQDVDRIRQRVLEDIYGVHPMALACLLKLSGELGSNVRSTFTFFSGEVGGAKGSYAEFIENGDITVGGGKLNLYTVDRLFTFFEKELSLKNPELRDRQRQAVNGFYASMDALRKAAQQELFGLQSDERVRLLRTLLIYQLCQIPAGLENIQFGLYCLSAAENKEVEKRLKALVKQGVVFYRKQSETYELAASTGEDPYELIQRYLDNPSLHPQDLVDAFLNEAGERRDLEFMDAKGHNLPFNEDKRFRMRFVPAKDLGPALWQDIQADWETDRLKPKTAYEGTLVYALCEDEQEVKQAREAVKTISEENIAVAVPHEPQAFTETLLRVKACRHYLPPSEAEKISAQTESRLRDILENTQDGYLTLLKRRLNEIVDGDKACWYKKSGAVLVDKPKQSHKAADVLCGTLFDKRCKIKHTDVSKIHDDRWRTGRNTALKQAVAVLLNAEQVMIDNGNPDNHGEKRYLQKVLLKGAGALRQTGSEGTVTYFECETDPTVISEDFPVLKRLCEALAQLSDGESFSLGAFLDEMRSPPFGAGGTALALALAHVLRGYGERLVIYKDSTKMVRQTITSYDDIVGILDDPVTKAVFEVRDISEPQQALIEAVAKALGATPLKHGQSRTLNEAYEVMVAWWKEIPEIAKVDVLYNAEKRPLLDRIKLFLDGLDTHPDRFSVMLAQLPRALSEDYDGTPLTQSDAAGMAESFEEAVKLFDRGEQLAKHHMAEKACAVFDTEGDMVVCEQAVTNWYQGLNPSQRSVDQYEHEDAAFLLKRLGDTSQAFERKLTALLPKDFGFGELREWSSLQVEDFTAKLKQAKQEIEKVKTPVYPPQIPEKDKELQDGEARWVNVPKGAEALIYTLDGTDPRHSDQAIQTDAKLDLGELLKDKAAINVKMRAIDQQGNYSVPVDVPLVSKSRKFDIQEESTLFGRRATFTCPENREDMGDVLKSVLRYGIEKKLLTKEEATSLKEALEDIMGSS